MSKELEIRIILLEQKIERLERKEKIYKINFLSQYGMKVPIENEIKLIALEIIKNKAVNVQRLLHTKSVEEYNLCMSIGCLLTKEEYNLSKAVLENDYSNQN